MIRERARRLLGVETRTWQPATLAAMVGERAVWRDGGATVTSSTSLAHSAVFACRSLIAGTVAGFPYHVFRDVDGGARRSGAEPLIDQPDPQPTMRAAGWRYAVVDGWLAAGFAGGLVVSTSSAGWPTAIELVDPGRVGWSRQAAGGWRWTIDGAGEELWELGGRLWVSPSRYQLAGSPVGLSVLTAARLAVALGLEAQAFGSGWFTSGGHPSAILSLDVPSLTSDQATEIKRRFLASVQAREPVAMAASAKYTPIQINPEESQFLETSAANAADVARFFGVPPESIGASSGGSLTYNNGEALNRRLHTQATGPWMDWLAAELTRLMPRPRYVKGNPGALLRMDTAARYQAHAVGIAAGFLTPNEARRLEELPDIDGADALTPSRGGVPNVAP